MKSRHAGRIESRTYRAILYAKRRFVLGGGLSDSPEPPGYFRDPFG